MEIRSRGTNTSFGKHQSSSPFISSHVSRGRVLSSSSDSSAAAARLPWSSWKSPGSSGLFGFFGSPNVSKWVLTRTRFSVSLDSVVDQGLQSLRASLQRRSFDPRRLFSSPWSFWGYALPTPEGAVLSLIGANVAVFFLWRIADPTFMRKHFMISLDNFKSGRWHTLITSAFSHADLDHLVTNMIGLYFFGSQISRLFGPEFLLKLYLAGALGGSIFFLVHGAITASSSESLQRWHSSRIAGLGASAAVNSIILLDIFLFPKNIYYVNLIIPVPAMLMGAILIGSDLWRIKKGDEHISGSAHLGGAVVAALVFARLKHWI
ncbi:RHOMBOID-like protein 12, mitochondrial [Dioscorea cayenensis subsp. rotundata]|uniref:RHOMBOID-like protein 12, mitochondrial n=1 Tax=Dioscorea cayennensis subsp. rotundata TaxID=55577 RepID=A0AB40BVU7_DIOCR|nr:RHOMBOID-like protein 12, mitochondrial [Dioscorea cayenensis subsp. rotundata]